MEVNVSLLLFVPYDWCLVVTQELPHSCYVSQVMLLILGSDWFHVVLRDARTFDVVVTVVLTSKQVHQGSYSLTIDIGQWSVQVEVPGRSRRVLEVGALQGYILADVHDASLVR